MLLEYQVRYFADAVRGRQNGNKVFGEQLRFVVKAFNGKQQQHSETEGSNSSSY